MSGMFEDRLASTHVVGEDYADSMKLARPARPAQQSEPAPQQQQPQVPAVDDIDPAVLAEAVAIVQAQQQLAAQQQAPAQPQVEPAVGPVAEVEPQQAPVEAEHEELETDGAAHLAEPEVEDDFGPEPEALSSGPEHDEVGTFQRAGSSATSAPAQTSETAEPTPQRDDPDDGEHVQSEPEPTQQAAAVADDPQDEVESEQVDLSSAEQQDENPWRSTDQSNQEQADLVAMVLSAQPAHTQVSAPLEWAGPNVGFEFPGGSSQVKVPRQLLAALRACLRPMGKDFAEKISVSSLVTGFVLARLGLPATGADPNTEQAARAFAEMTPELSALEHRLDATTTALQELAGSVRSMERDTEAVRRSMDVVELSNAYLLTDRYSPISSPGTTGSTLEVQHPKVLGTRENLRKQAESQRNADKISDGRPW